MIAKAGGWVYEGSLYNSFILAAPWSMWDLSSMTKDGTHAPCIGSVDSYPLENLQVLYPYNSLTHKIFHN